MLAGTNARLHGPPCFPILGELGELDHIIMFGWVHQDRLFLVGFRFQNHGEARNVNKQHTLSQHLTRCFCLSLAPREDMVISGVAREKGGNLMRFVPWLLSAFVAVSAADLDAWEWILSPIKPSRFFLRYWEQKSLWVGRSESDHYGAFGINSSTVHLLLEVSQRTVISLPKK